MKKARIRSKHGFNGFRKFFLGFVMGIVSTILLLAGIGFWAYASLDLQTVEKLTKTNITDNNSLEKMTIKKAVAIMQGIAGTDTNTYTLAQFEEDFGITLPNSLGNTGITLEIVKNYPFKDMSQAVKETLETITFDNILELIGIEKADKLGVIDTLLDKEITYYVSLGKLYTNPERTIEVDFNYIIDGSTVRLNTGIQNTIAANKVKFILSDLPLNSALTNMANTTENLKIYELLDYHYDSVTDRYYKNYNAGVYSNPVGGVMDAIAGYTIDELTTQSKIDELKLCDVLGYYYNEEDGFYYTSESFTLSSRVNSVMNSIADKSIGDLADDDTFNSLHIYEVMGYYYNSGDECYYTNSDFSAESKVTGIMATIAGKTIAQLDDEGTFNDVLLADALGYTISGSRVFESDGVTEVTGVIKQLVLNGSTVSTISTDVKALTIDQILDVDPSDDDTSNVIKALSARGATIDTLNQNINSLTLIEILGENPNNTPIINALSSANLSSLSVRISDLTLGETLGKTYDESTGVLKTFYNTKVSELAGEIEDIKIWQAMGYTQLGNQDDGYTYKDAQGNDVTGIMASLASKSVSELSNSDTFDTLYIYDVMGYYYNEANDTYYISQDDLSDANKVSGIMSLLNDTQLNSVEEKINDIINNTNVYELICSGVIDISLDVEEDEATIEFLSSHTMPSLLQFINDNIDILVYLGSQD